MFSSDNGPTLACGEPESSAAASAMPMGATSAWPPLSGAGPFNRREPFLWVYFDNVITIGQGRWKLHVGHSDKALACEYSEVAAQLRTKVDTFQKGVPQAWRLDYLIHDPLKRKSGQRPPVRHGKGAQ